MHERDAGQLYSPRPGRLVQRALANGRKDAGRCSTGQAALNRREAYCREGHLFTPETTITDRSTGLRRCRICRNAKARSRWAAAHAELYAERAARAQRQTKPCTYCKVERPLSEFGENKACIDGHRSRCRKCESEWAAQRRKNNPQLAKEASRRFEAAHPERKREKLRRWRERNRDNQEQKQKAVKRALAWARKNPHRAGAHKARHRAAKLGAIPAWARRDEIAAIYETARALGPGFHVDHIIPLQGESVCGLHCEANLQIIPASVNIAKRNRSWPDMFGRGER